MPPLANTSQEVWRQETARKCLPAKLTETRNVAVIVRSGHAKSAEVAEEWHFGDASIPSDSVFELGSLTKIFSSALLLKMAQAGTLSLRDPLAQHLPGIVPNDCNVTLLDLATHCSGLPRLPPGINLEKNPYAAYTADRLTRYIDRYNWRTSARSPFLYSNLGYAVLGLALETAGKNSFSALLEQHVLQPFGLKNTFVATRPEAKPSDPQSSTRCRVNGHTESGFRAHLWDWQVFAPCGGLVGTARDVGQLLTHLYADPSVAELFQPFAQAGAGHVGLGWILPADRPVAWHNGGTAGFSSYASIHLPTGKWLVVLTNRYTPQIAAIGRALESCCFFGEPPRNPPKSKFLKPLLRDTAAAFVQLPWWIRFPAAAGIVILLARLVRFLSVHH